MAKNMARELTSLRMDENIKDNGTTMKSMVKDYTLLTVQVKKTIMDILSMEKCLEEEN